MIVEILPAAEADLIRQFNFYLVDQDAPTVAYRFRESVIDSIEQLKPNPRIGVLLRSSLSDIRSWPVKGFTAIRIYYVEVASGLRVVRILHGRRNVRRILKQDVS